MYYRLYPDKTNTIFRIKDSTTSNLSFPIDPTTLGNVSNLWSYNTNNGANPVMELQDGKGESRLLFSFNIPSWLQSKIASNSFVCNLKMYDCGTLFEPALPSRNLQLSYFINDFVEGDGYSYVLGKATQGYSNFLYRDSVNSWVGTTLTPIETYNPNYFNEDLSFTVTSSVTSSLIDNSGQPKFMLYITNQTADYNNIYRKFIWGHYTRTVFKPYLEFMINDTILDSSYNFYSDSSNKFYLVNQSGVDFIGAVQCSYTIDGQTTQVVTATKQSSGVYYVSITTPSFTSNNKLYANLFWSVNGVVLYKSIVELKNINQVISDYDIKTLYFYPTSSYSHNIVRQGDIIPYEIISEIRGKGKFFLTGYQYKVVSLDGFELIPWTDANIYREKIYFNVHTSFLFPENEYEVLVRYQNEYATITSSLTSRFKLIEGNLSRLRDLNTSPYFPRDYFLQK